MASQGQQLYSTPAFELFRRGLTTQSVKNFRGISAYQSVTSLGPEWALDCQNVMVPGWGGLSKFRYPVAQSLAGISGSGAGPVFFTDFQQNNGTRQVVANFANNSLWTLTGDMTAKTLIDAGATDAPIWSMVEANNILFMANGQRMEKWTGANFWQWGIAAPTASLELSSPNIDIFSIQRAGGVLTITLNFGNIGGNIYQPVYLNVGDTVTVVGNTGDPTMNGTFAIATVVTPGLSYTVNQAGANSGPFTQASGAGNITFPSESGVFAGATASRTAGTIGFVLAHPAFVGNGVSAVGLQIVTSGWADPTFNGTFIVVSSVLSFGCLVSFSVLQAGPDSVAAGTGTVTTGVSFTTDKVYGFSYTNVITGHVSSVGPSFTLPGPVTNRILFFSVPPSPDPQVSGLIVFASLDSGADLFRVPTSSILGNGSSIDISPDASLDTSTQAPLLNNPPLQGNFLAVGQSRVFVANLTGATTDIIYSGYEQILLGRPEESFPPNNRLKLAIGASAIAGIGVLHHGVVAFSNLDRMYTLRGQLEDISISAPVQFSAFLEEMPWKIGCKSHATIQATPFGLLWWASDNTVQLFSFGSASTGTASNLQDMSRNVYPLLRQATPGFEFNAQSAYFNWLERDWYALLFSANGSVTPNQLIFWGLNAETSAIDVFPCNVPANSIGVITTSKLQKLLCIGINDQIFNLPISQDTSGGISPSPNTIIPNTGNNLPAHWNSGYFGNETPTRSKMFRRALVVTDIPADPTNMTMTAAIVDNLQHNIRNPLMVGPVGVPTSGLASIGMRGNRCSIQLTFPLIDASVNVLELSLGSIGTSDR
jgi:hypothetical protein